MNLARRQFIASCVKLWPRHSAVAGRLTINVRANLLQNIPATRMSSSADVCLIQNDGTKHISSLPSCNIRDKIRQSNPTENDTMTSHNHWIHANGNHDDDDDDDYTRAIRDLNSLQSNSQVIALAKYKQPETILPLFRQQLALAGIYVEELNRLNVIHVSGTKGKGSTCAFLEQILTKSDKIKLKVGSYNSPHLVSVTERIRVNGRPIDRATFCKYFRHVFDKLKFETQKEGITMPSYFSFLTILAFHIFLEEQVDCAIIEVGMGGEYDPTNVVEKPLACAITTLDLDHTNILGKTIERIAWTKAGIIKSSAPLFTINHEQKEANKMIEMRAREKESPVYICRPLDHHYHQLNLGIQSSAQYINASLACQLAAYLLAKYVQDKYKIHKSPEFMLNGGLDGRKPVELETNLKKLPEFFQTGLVSCQLPGRCQIVKCPGATYFLDGAHTRKSMENCLSWFEEVSQSADGCASRLLMVNVIGERDKAEVLRPLSRFKTFDQVLFSTNKIRSDSNDLASTSETFAKIQDHNYEKGLDNAKMNASIWQDLVDEFSDNNPDAIEGKSPTTTHASIMDCISFIENHKTSISTGIQPNAMHSRPLHVLATGSLHFVGAILEALAATYPDEINNH